MPRIRSIKPEFWSDEKLSPMPVMTRFTFLALISMADDYGRLVDSAAQIVAFMHPYLEEEEAFASASRDVRDALAKLTETGRIIRGTTASGQKIIQLAHWSRHQRVDHPNEKAALPQIVAGTNDGSSRERVASDSRAQDERGASAERVDLRSTIYDLRSTSNDHGPDAADAAPVPGQARATKREPWSEALHAWWVEHIGSIDRGALAKFAAPLRRRYGGEKLRQAALVYFSADEGPRFKTPKDFFTNFGTWHALAQEPLSIDGVLTERGRRLGGQAA